MRKISEKIGVAALLLTLVVLATSSGGLASAGVAAAAVPRSLVVASSNDGMEVFQLGPAFHPRLGRDLQLQGHLAGVWPELAVSGRFGVSLVDASNRRARYFPLPQNAEGGGIVSLVWAGRAWWVGTETGRVHRLDTGSWQWRSRQLASSRTVLHLSLAGDELLALEGKKGGRIHRLALDGSGSAVVFTMPDSVGARPSSAFRFGQWTWVGTDAGVLRFRASRWEMPGVRHGVSLRQVQAFAAFGSRLLVATSRPQFARVPVGYEERWNGVFYYNERQQRSERLPEGNRFPDPALLPGNGPAGGGLFLLDPETTDPIPFTLARRADQPAVDLFRLVALAPDLFLAASRSRLTLINAGTNRLSLQHVVGPVRRVPADLAVSRGRVVMLLGERLLVSRSVDWERAAGRVPPRDQEAGAADPGAMLHPDDALTEEGRFIRQIEQYLRHLPRTE